MASEIPANSSSPLPEQTPLAAENGNKAPEIIEADSFLIDAEPEVEDEPVVEPEPEPEQAVPAADPATPVQNEEVDVNAVIEAQPITTVAPGGSSGRKRTRDPVEMAKRPHWLPEDFQMDCKARINGATAGLIDRYYFTHDRSVRFRSRVEVTAYLEKLKSGSADAGPSESPVGKKKRSKKTDAEASGSGSQKKRKYTRKPKQAEPAAAAAAPAPDATEPAAAAAEVPAAEEVPVETGAGREDGLTEGEGDNNGEADAES